MGGVAWKDNKYVFKWSTGKQGATEHYFRAECEACEDDNVVILTDLIIMVSRLQAGKDLWTEVIDHSAPIKNSVHTGEFQHLVQLGC